MGGVFFCITLVTSETDFRLSDAVTMMVSVNKYPSIVMIHNIKYLLSLIMINNFFIFVRIRLTLLVLPCEDFHIWYKTKNILSKEKMLKFVGFYHISSIFRSI